MAKLVFWLQIDVDPMKDELLAIMLLPPSTWSMLQSNQLRVRVAAANESGATEVWREGAPVLDCRFENHTLETQINPPKPNAIQYITTPNPAS